MKLLILPFLLFLSFNLYSQKSFNIKGRILDPQSNPIESAYVINYRTLSVYATNKKGEFDIPVEENDSLIINHLSFVRKKIYAATVRYNPEIYLEYDTMLIREIVITPGPDKDSLALAKTIEMIRSADIKVFKRMDPDMNIVNQTVVENNIVFRSQASSISIASFSPSAVVNSIIENNKKKKKNKGFRFYRNKEQMIRKERKKAE